LWVFLDSATFKSQVVLESTTCTSPWSPAIPGISGYISELWPSNRI
jgi:hypothetical protein